MTGFFDRPNRLDVPGEELPKVTHYYREPFGYARQKVAVSGCEFPAAFVKVTVTELTVDVSP